MSDHITLVGNITGELDQRATRGGEPIAAFRLAVGERKLDRERGEWVDGHTNFYNVSVFGDLGAHALTSLRKGQRVILTGRLRVREWENETKRGVSADVVVDAIGHDLRWGTSQFTRAPRPVTAADTSAHAEGTNGATDADGWAVPGAQAGSATPDAGDSEQPTLVGAEGGAGPF